MSHMSATGSTEFMKGSVDGGVYKTRLGFLLLRTIHRYKPGLKKGEGGSFPARQAGKFGIVCSRQGDRKGNKQIKVERLSFADFSEYVPTGVYRAHLKNIRFSVL